MNNKITFYEIDSQILDCIDPETGEIINEEGLNKLEMTKEEKIANIGKFISFTTGEVAQMEEVAKRVLEGAKAKKQKIDNIKSYLAEYMNSQDIKKIEYPLGSVTVCKNPPSLILEEALQKKIESGLTALEEKLKQEKAIVASKRKGIKDSLLAGAEVEGARLSQGISLRIV